MRRTFSGTPDEAWFVAVHLAIESIGGEVVSAVDVAERAAAEEDFGAMGSALEAIADALRWSTGVLGRIHENLDPDIFRAQVRPNLFGFANVVFESAPPIRVSYVGETGAQSGVIQAIDTVLAVPHQPPMNRALERFRACAPPTHRAYMSTARAVGTVVSREAQRQGAVKRSHIIALQELQRFRLLHTEIVEHYLSTATPGTGGTTGHPWLRALCDDVSEAIAAYA